EARLGVRQGDQSRPRAEGLSPLAPLPLFARGFRRGLFIVRALEWQRNRREVSRPKLPVNLVVRHRHPTQVEPSLLDIIQSVVKRGEQERIREGVFSMQIRPRVSEVIDSSIKIGSPIP